MPTLNWIGKDAVIRHHKEVPLRLLEPVASLSTGADSGNILVQGDNLDALKALLPRYDGQIKCIYIDPPYNTGNEGWSYNDNVNSPQMRKWLGQVVGKEDLDRHDRWLCMIYPRLVLLRQFLRDDGAIFISIDDNEQANLKLLCDEIFGLNNFVANIIWHKRTAKSDVPYGVSQDCEFILCYAKTKSFMASISGKERKYYTTPDFPNRPWRYHDLTKQTTAEERPNSYFTIANPKNGNKYPASKLRTWAITSDTFQQYYEAGRIIFPGDYAFLKIKRPVLRYWQEDDLKKASAESGKVAASTFLPSEVGMTQNGTRDITDIFHEKIFSFPKPASLIRHIISIATDKNDIILDSFAGSGTTGHAVLQQNAEDGGSRRFILVEMDREIAENVTSERLRRVSCGYTNAKGEPVSGLGGDFQYLRLSKEPLFAPDGQIREDVTFSQLAAFIWFMETKTAYTGRADSPLLGIHQGRAIYLLYNGILGDKSREGGNTLTREIFASLPRHQGPKTIYAAAVWGREWLKAQEITFKQTPYKIVDS